MDKDKKDNVGKEGEDMELLAPSTNPKSMTRNKKSILSKIMGNYSTKVDLNKLRDARKNEKN